MINEIGEIALAKFQNFSKAELCLTRKSVKDMDEDFLTKKLHERKDQHAIRSLKLPAKGMIDFCSNDYLGIVKRNLLERTDHLQKATRPGSTGSRLLSGNYALIEEAERYIAGFHEAQTALIFNSGYDANFGLLSCIPQRGDLVLYDNLSHASIRDGIRLSFATSFSFQHNDLEDLDKKLETYPLAERKNIFVVTESVFSMDGDLAPLREMTSLCKKKDAHLVIDEAHASGVIGQKGEGLVQQLHLQDQCFARIHTFGKALGVHGAAVLGSTRLREYLINFCRPFIYTTALPESTITHILESYHLFPSLDEERNILKELISAFQVSSCRFQKLNSNTPIQAVIVPGNDQAKAVAEMLQQNKFDVRAILYPTVPRGQERLRIVLHAFNTIEEISALAMLLR